MYGDNDTGNGDDIIFDFDEDENQNAKDAMTRIKVIEIMLRAITAIVAAGIYVIKFIYQIEKLNPAA